MRVAWSAVKLKKLVSMVAMKEERERMWLIMFRFVVIMWGIY